MALRMGWGDPGRRPCPLARHSQVRGCREEGREQCGRLFRRPSAWSPDPAFHAPRPNRRGPARRGKSPLIWCWREGGKVILRCLRRWVIGPRGLARVRAQRRLPSLGGAAARALGSRRPGSDMGRGGGGAGGRGRQESGKRRKHPFRCDPQAFEIGSSASVAGRARLGRVVVARTLCEGARGRGRHLHGEWEADSLRNMNKVPCEDSASSRGVLPFPPPAPRASASLAGEPRGGASRAPSRGRRAMTQGSSALTCCSPAPPTLPATWGPSSPFYTQLTG